MTDFETASPRNCYKAMPETKIPVCPLQTNALGDGTMTYIRSKIASGNPVQSESGYGQQFAIICMSVYKRCATRSHLTWLSFDFL